MKLEGSGLTNYRFARDYTLRPGVVKTWIAGGTRSAIGRYLVDNNWELVGLILWPNLMPGSIIASWQPAL